MSVGVSVGVSVGASAGGNCLGRAQWECPRSRVVPPSAASSLKSPRAESREPRAVVRRAHGPPPSPSAPRGRFLHIPAMAADPPALRQLAVRRTARYLTMGVPSPATRELWYVCHGYGQLAAEFIRDFAVLDDDSRLVVAPEALNRFYKNPEPSRHRIGGVGATWMTSEARELEIDDYVAYLDDLHAHLTADAVAGGADPDSLRVRVLGFSQGAATAARWVALGR